MQIREWCAKELGVRASSAIEKRFIYVYDCTIVLKRIRNSSSRLSSNIV
jgi:hypothetical protein